MMHLVCAASRRNGRGLGTTLPAPAVSATYDRGHAMHNSDVCVCLCMHVCVSTLLMFGVGFPGLWLSIVLCAIGSGRDMRSMFGEGF